MKSLLAMVSAAILAAPAAAGVTGGLDGTFGSAGYRGFRAKAAVDLDDGTYLQPSVAAYRSDDSSGTFKRIGMRAGYERGPFAFGLQGGYAPETNGYTQASGGADVTFSLTPGGSKSGRKMAGPSSGGTSTFGSGLAAIDVGASFTRIQHWDEYAAVSSAGPGTRRQGARRARTFTVGQNDVSVFAGAKFLIAEFSGEVTKSAYDKNLDENAARESQLQPLRGVDSIQQGFPDVGWNLQAKLKTFPLVRPFASVTHTTFKRGQAASNAYEFGATLGLEMVSVRGAYERYVQGGFPDRNYVTVGASVYF